MSKRTPLLYINDIIESAEAIFTYTVDIVLRELNFFHGLCENYSVSRID